MHNRGYAFVDVKPRIQKDTAKHTVALTFDIGEGPRVYVERIDIVGNTRTEDKVIRREFRLAEGDPFNAEAVRRTRQRLEDLGYFGGVDINTSPGSAPDKAILTTTVDEKSTGELTVGGGYSTDAGALLDIGLSEKQSGRHRQQCRHQRRAGAEAQFDHRLVHRSVLPRSQPGGRWGRLPGPDQLSGHRAVRREAGRLRRARRL